MLSATIEERLQHDQAEALVKVRESARLKREFRRAMEQRKKQLRREGKERQRRREER